VKLIYCIAIIFILVSLQVKGQLYINEVSQGTGNPPDEFIELVVVGQTTCVDTCLDIRGWIIDDNNGFFGSSGIAGGHLRLTNDPQWACVPYGSIIVLYSNYNTPAGVSIDSADSNNDQIYILNPTIRTLIESDGSLPAPSTPSASYAGGSYGSGGQWNMLALRNDGDVIQLIDPTNLNASFFSVGWGDATGTSTYFTGSAANLCYAFYNDFSDDINNQTNWSALGIANSTPGAANNAANQLWLDNMKTVQNFPESYDTIQGCSGDSVFYPPTSSWYRTNNTFTEVIPIGICDSTAYHTIYFKPVSITNDTVIECSIDSIEYKGNWYYSDTMVNDTLSNSNGCDSVVEVYLLFGTNTLIRDTLLGCEGDSIFLNGTWFKQDTLIIQNLNTVSGCDSTIENHIIFYPSMLIEDSLYYCEGDTISINGKLVYNDTVTTEVFAYGNCDSTIINSYFFLPKKQSYDTIVFCFGDSVEINNMWFSKDTTLVEVFLTTMCDSVHSITLTELVEVLPITDSMTICPGEFVLINGMQYTSDTNFTVSYTTTMCDSIVDYKVELIEVPNLNIYGDSTLCLENNEMLTLTASDGFDDYTWSTGESGISTEVSESGSYSVEAIFRGCLASDTIQVEKIWCDSSCLRYIPSAITPNNDGINDMFSIAFDDTFCDFSSAEYRIFNRWGKLIFTSEEITDSWDGTFKGRAVEPDIYIYKINYLLKGDVEQRHITGHLSIIK